MPWLHPAGARVDAGQPILEITTEKVTFEVPSPAAGILHHVAELGANLHVEALVGYIRAEGEALPTGSASVPVLPLERADGRCCGSSLLNSKRQIFAHFRKFARQDSVSKAGLEKIPSVTPCNLRTNPYVEPWKTPRPGRSIAPLTLGDLPVQKLVLAICLLSVTAPFAAARNGGNGNGNQNGQPPQKHKGHAPEMSGTAMAAAGIIGLGGYFLIRRRVARQN